MNVGPFTKKQCLLLERKGVELKLMRGLRVYTSEFLDYMVETKGLSPKHMIGYIVPFTVEVCKWFFEKGLEFNINDILEISPLKVIEWAGREYKNVNNREAVRLYKIYYVKNKYSPI